MPNGRKGSKEANKACWQTDKVFATWNRAGNAYPHTNMQYTLLMIRSKINKEKNYNCSMLGSYNYVWNTNKNKFRKLILQMLRFVYIQLAFPGHICWSPPESVPKPAKDHFHVSKKNLPMLHLENWNNNTYFSVLSLKLPQIISLC